MFKPPHDYPHLTLQQNNAQNSPSQVSTVHEPRTFRCSSGDYKRQRNQRSNCQHLLDHRKIKRVPEKHLFLFYWLCQSLLLGGSQQTGKFLKRWEYQTTSPASWESYTQVKKQQLEPNMEQWTGSKLEKENIKAVYCHLAYLTYIQSTSCKMPGWMKHKLKTRLPGERLITSDMQMTPPLWQKVKREKEPLDEGEGNGNPFQCSCLENLRDGGTWWAAVYGVTQSRTRLKWLSSSSSRDLKVLSKWYKERNCYG